MTGTGIKVSLADYFYESFNVSADCLSYFLHLNPDPICILFKIAYLRFVFRTLVLQRVQESRKRKEHIIYFQVLKYKRCRID